MNMGQFSLLNSVVLLVIVLRHRYVFGTCDGISRDLIVRLRRKSRL
jgi:hypothetical protein